MQATILCYHKVGLASKEGRRLNIEPSRLRSHVRFFSRKNYKFLCAGDLAAPWSDRTVCFTFDDAYASTMVHAPSIFEEFGTRATFYAVPGRVGGTSDWDGALARPLANWDLLTEAHRRGHEIGNHTQNHVHLANLSEEEQYKEISVAHENLVTQGLNPRSFCYPYGSHDQRTVTQVDKAGYQVALILGKRIATTDDKLLELPRIIAAYSDALPMLIYKLTLKPRLKQLTGK